MCKCKLFTLLILQHYILIFSTILKHLFFYSLEAASRLSKRMRTNTNGACFNEYVNNITITDLLKYIIHSCLFVFARSDLDLISDDSDLDRSRKRSTRESPNITRAMPLSGLTRIGPTYVKSWTSNIGANYKHDCLATVRAARRHRRLSLPVVTCLTACACNLRTGGAS